MARLRTRVERAAVLHRQAAAAAAAIATAVERYSPASAPVAQYAEQRELAARLRSAAADLTPGWLGGSLPELTGATSLGATVVPGYIRLGLAHPLDDARFPAVAPLFGAGHVAIDADARDPRVAGLLRGVLLRVVAASAPGTVRIRVVDAACAGETTAAFAAVPGIVPPPVTDHPGLQEVLVEAGRWVDEARPAGHYSLLVIASLPELTDGGDLHRIARLARAGVGRGLHLIVAGWPPPPLTADTTQPPLPHSTQVSLRNPYAWMGDPPGATYSGTRVGPGRLNAPVYLDPDPPAELIRQVCAELSADGQPSEQPESTPPPARWLDYVTSAQRLDVVRREAAKVVNEQSAALKRARAELSTVRGMLGAQQNQIADLLGNGQPVPLTPMPGELGAAEAALGRLARAAAERALAGKGAMTTGSFPSVGTASGAFPTVAAPTTGTVSGAFPTIAANPPDRTGALPTAEPTTAALPNAEPTTAALPNAAPTAGVLPPAAGPAAGALPGFAGPSGSFPMVAPATGPPPGHPAQSRPGTPGVGGPPGRAVTTPPPGTPPPHPAQSAHPGVDRAAQVQVTSPPRPGGPVPPTPVSAPVGRPPGSGPPPAVHSTTGSFPVIMPASQWGTPRPDAPPSASPRLPEAALSMLSEARTALGRADGELTNVDARVRSSPAIRNAAVYATYAVMFALVHVLLLTILATSDEVPAIIGAPCGLIFVVLSFALGWITIGFQYQQPGGQRPPRTPALGGLISLIAITPTLATLLWTALTLVRS